MKSSEGTRLALAVVLFAVFHLGAADNPGAGGQLRQLRFSWDGNYVLAQDDSIITILSTKPLAVLFRLPAEAATLAQFTADSKEVNFVSSLTQGNSALLKVARGEPLLERWSVSRASPTAAIHLGASIRGKVVLSQDAHWLACVDFAGTLRVIDTNSLELIFERRSFVQPVFTVVQLQRYDLAPTDPQAARLVFSPDSRFLVAVGVGGPAGGRTLIVDLAGRQLIGRAAGLGVLGNAAHWNIKFIFLGPGELAMACGTWAKNYIEIARVVAFPAGAPVAKVRVPTGPELRRAADPAFLVVPRPYRAEFLRLHYSSVRVPWPTEGAVAVELSTGSMITSQTPLLDVFGSHYVAEVNPGEVGLYERGKGLQATVVLHQK